MTSCRGMSARGPNERSVCCFSWTAIVTTCRTATRCHHDVQQFHNEFATGAIPTDCAAWVARTEEAPCDTHGLRILDLKHGLRSRSAVILLQFYHQRSLGCGELVAECLDGGFEIRCTRSFCGWQFFGDRAIGSLVIVQGLVGFRRASVISAARRKQDKETSSERHQDHHRHELVVGDCFVLGKKQTPFGGRRFGLAVALGGG